jgi:hypothetical protein
VSTGVALTEPEKSAERAASERVRRFLIDGGTPTKDARAAVQPVFNLAEVLERTYLTRWKNTKSDIQLKYVVGRLEREIGHWLLSEIDYKRLKGYRDDCVRQGITPATVNRRMSILRVALKEAHKEDGIPMPAWPETLAEHPRALSVHRGGNAHRRLLAQAGSDRGHQGRTGVALHRCAVSVPAGHRLPPR